MRKRQILAFTVWTMTTLSSLSRAFCGGRQVSTSIFKSSTAFISPMHSNSVASCRQGRMITPIIIHQCCGRGSSSSRRRFSSSLAASSLPLQEGDNVIIAVNGESVQGIIQEVRGSGWYAVKVESSPNNNSNEANGNIIKVRGKQLSLATPLAQQTENDTTTSAPNESTVVPPPTIIDIDAALASARTDPVENKRDLEYLQQCAHHASVQKWIMFTDLHCAPSTLDTCLQVLQQVHAEALERNAGVLFLGDFWHHRATIRVDILNAVLAELRSWQVPSILIPGNHDQVTLGGHNHGLTPLEHAYRVECHNNKKEENMSSSSVAGPLVFSHPTKFMNALFVPHIRDVTIMESVLSSNHSVEANCLFVHADVTGAYMNDLIVSQGGVPPLCFPAHVPIYSGHFHKPHVVKRGQVCIEYIGSPYETSLAEAQQQKALLVLDAADDWKCVERIPLHIGRKHFRATTMDELLALHVASTSNTTVTSSPRDDDSIVKSGDRVVVTLPKDDLERERRQSAPGNVSPVDAQIKTLRQAGVVVEVREIPSQALGPLVQPQEVVEEMTPQRTLAAFLTEEVRRESLKNNTAQELLKAGLVLLDELELSEDLNGALDPSGDMTDLTLESVSLQGFGSFKDSVTYPLGGRGLVLVRGTNQDGGGDSNGSGKSSLAMATLWALTGTLDPRPMQDSKVSDVVNDASKSARVSVRGTLSDKPFVITRTKTSTKGALVFHLDGQDLTTQSIKDTQAIIDENLGVGSQIVARTMFHGQFAMNGLLEATDARFKEELSLVVPLSLWQQGATTARAKSREASKKSAEFEGMIRLRSSDMDDLVKRRDEAESALTSKQTLFEQMEAQVMKEIKEIRDATVDVVDMEATQRNLETASANIQELESILNGITAERDSNLDLIHTRHNDAESQHTLAQNGLHSKLLAYDQAVLKLENIDNHRKHLETKWNLDIHTGLNVDMVPPQVCPTCQQPLSSTGKGHSHEEMQRIARQEIDAVLTSLADAQAALEKASDDRNYATDSTAVATSAMTEVRDELAEARAMWAERVTKVETDLHNARTEQAMLSAQIASAAKAMQQEAIIQSKESILSEEKKAVQAKQAVYQDLCTNAEQAETRLQELRASGEAQRSLSVTMTNLVNIFGPRGVQTYILQNAIDSLQTISQVYLDELSDGSQRLELKLDAGDRISRRAMIRGADGEFVERPLSSLSGGQWRRCSLALSLGFSNLVSSRGRFQSSLVVLDEPLTHLDRSGRSRVGGLLRSLLQNGDGSGVTPLSLHGMAVSTILVILQDLAAEELEESFDHIDEVVKRNGMSTVSIDEQT